MAKRVFARGLNILGKRKITKVRQDSTTLAVSRSLPKFRFCVIELLNLFTVVLCRTICYLVTISLKIGDGQIIQTGYVLDNFTSVRILNFYQKMPKTFLAYQVPEDGCRNMLSQYYATH